MTGDEVLAWLKAEYAAPFAGWDFSYLRDRRHDVDHAPWDYSTIAQERLRTATAVLDVDTGDGMRFADTLTESGFQGRACATEGYGPNIPLARATLEPLGVEVRETGTSLHPSSATPSADAKRLPFEDASFDLVLNRHGSLYSVETKRVLRPGGWLVTQQVGSKTNLEIHYLLDAPLPTGTRDLATCRAWLEAAGFRIRRALEAFTTTRYDVGALVWYLKAVPWQIPNFSVDRYAGKLVALHRQVERTGIPIDVGFHTFLLVAQA
jgi:SAM-dependent methyltransferase